MQRRRKRVRRGICFVLALLTLLASMSHMSDENTLQPVGETKFSNNVTSNLSFGPQSGLNVYVPPGGFISFAVNMTNSANQSDIVDFVLVNSAGWSCAWNTTGGTCGQPLQTPMSPGELIWTKFDIWIPALDNGTPLAGDQVDFSLSATSGLDGATHHYNFTLEPDEEHGAVIDTEDYQLTMDPGVKQRVPVQVRNIGNADAGLVARIVPIDQYGTPYYWYEPDLLYEKDGWAAGVFSVHHLNGNSGGGLGPNGTATIEIEIQPPYLTSGSHRTQLMVWSVEEPNQIETLIIDATIERVRGGEVELIDGCDGADILPFENCPIGVKVSNTGNFEDSFEIVVEGEDWMRLDLSISVLALSNGEDNEGESMLTVWVNEMTPAFSYGTVTVILKLIDGEELASVSTNLRVAPLVDWEINAVDTSTDSQQNVSVAFTLRNIGNGNDGLQIGMHVDHSVPYALIPPENSTHGAEDGMPRYFEIDGLEPGRNFTFRAWMNMPETSEANGTLSMTIDMQSTLKPEIVMTNLTQINYLANQYREDSEETSEALLTVLERLLASIWNEYNGLALTILVTVVGSLGLYRAVLHRQRKDAEWRELHGLDREEVVEKPKDWMDKFSKRSSVKDAVSQTGEKAPTIAGKVFKDIFASKSRRSQPSKAAPSKQVMEAAKTVLTHHESKIEMDMLDELVQDIDNESDSHPANEMLQPENSETGRTVRKEKTKTAPKADEGVTKTPASTGSNKVKTDDSDLDFDL